MSDPMKEISRHFDFIFEGVQTPFYVYLASMQEGGNFKQYVIPSNMRSKIPNLVMMMTAEGKDVYYSPSPFKDNEGERPSPTREAAIGSTVLWADFDNGQAPADWNKFCAETGIPLPTKVIQSSVEGNQHAYWGLDKLYDTEFIEDRNRALAFRVNADKSGWDINQLLRVPFTKNFGWAKPNEHKYWYNGEPADVKLLIDETHRGDGAQFSSTLGDPSKELSIKLDYDNLPTYEEVLTQGDMTEKIVAILDMDKDQARDSFSGKRSGGLMFTAYLMAEQLGKGFTDEQMYVILDHLDTKWEKYVDRSKAGRRKILIDTIVRARAKYGYPVGEEPLFTNLLGEPSQAVENKEEIKTLYSVKEFLDSEIVINWLYKDRIPTKCFGFIVGEPGVGKSQLSLNMAMAMASGQDFLGWENVMGPQRVLYLSLEMSHAGLKLFVSKIIRGYEGDMPTLDSNLHISPLGIPIPLNSPEGTMFVESLIQQTKPDYIVIDSLQRLTMESLNDEVGMRSLMEKMSKIQKQNDCGMVVVHHTRKRGSGQQKETPDLNSVYGAQWIAANTDFIFGLMRGEGCVELYDFKMRYTQMNEKPLLLTRTANLNFEIQTKLDATEDEIVGFANMGSTKKSGLLDVLSNATKATL